MYKGVYKAYTYKVDANGKVIGILLARFDVSGNIGYVDREYSLDCKGQYNVFVDAFIDGIEHFEKTGEEPERNVYLTR